MTGLPALRAAVRAPFVASVALAFLLSGTAGASAAGDPSDPLPEFDAGGDEKHFFASATFVGRETATLDSVGVEFGIARGRIGNPPLLRVRVLDAQGAVLQAFDEWHPLWEFHWNGDAESLLVKSNGRGEFVFPFDPDAAVLEMNDVALAQEVLRGDLTGAVSEFCASHPEDPDCEVADLRVSDVRVVEAPALILFGQSASMSVRTVVENAGPDGPIATRVIRSVSVGAGLSMTPNDDVEDELSLALAASAELDRSYTLECLTPGVHALTFTGHVEAVRAATVDPDPSNDDKSLEVAVDCSVPVAINVKPGGSTNPIQLRSADVPLAILSTEVGEYGLPVAIDASSVEPASLRFGTRESVAGGSGGPEIHGLAHLEDALERDERTRDGDTDAVAHFEPAQSGLTVGDQEACVRGRFAAGSGAGAVGFLGCDAATVRASGPGL